MPALRDPRFRRLVVGQGFSSFGDSALYLSLGIWVKDLTGSNGAAGAVFLALGLPALLAPFTGHLVDRVRHRRALIIATEAAAAALVCALLLVRTREQVWLIYAVAALYGLALNIIGPATSALVKDVLPDTELGAANAARQTLGQGLRLLSPLVGAGVYAAAGGGTLAALDAATFGVSIAALVGVRVAESPVDPGPDGVSFGRRIAAGFAHIRADELLWRITTTAAIAMLGIGLFESIDFAIVAALDRPPSFFGVLMSVQGGGSILGGLAVTPVLRRVGEGRTVGLGLLGLAGAAGGLVVAALPAVLVSLVLLGVAVSFYFVGLGTALQRYTPPRLQGRVNSAGFVLTQVPQTASIALGALLIGALDYRILLVAVALASGLGAVALRTAPSRHPAAPTGLAVTRSA